jgi:hypothetical protein
MLRMRNVDICVMDDNVPHILKFIETVQTLPWNPQEDFTSNYFMLYSETHIRDLQVILKGNSFINVYRIIEEVVLFIILKPSVIILEDTYIYNSSSPLLKELFSLK